MMSIPFARVEILIGLLVLTSVARADEQKVAFKDVPKAVLDAVKVKFPKAELTGAVQETEEGKTTYEISLKDKGRKVDVALTADGKIKEIETEVAVKDLPAAVSAALEAKYPNATIKRAEQITEIDGDKESKNYEIVVVTEANEVGRGESLTGGQDQVGIMGIRILVIEDEEEIADFIVRGLREEGYTVETASDGDEGWYALKNGPWDLVLLDWWLPGRDGLTLLRRFRQAGHGTPVLFLTARDTVSDKVRGLDSGADDYLCKPFDYEELLARVRALARRQTDATTTILSHSDIRIDLATHRAERAGQRLDLTAKEQSLLVFFLRHCRRGAVPHPDLRACLGRTLRRALQHAGVSRDGAAAEAGGPRPPPDPHPQGPGLPLRRQT